MLINTLTIILNGLHQLKKSNAMKDSMVVGLISGATGSVAVEFINVLLGNKLFFGKVASSMVVNPLRSFRLKNILLGEIMHITVGAGIGSVIVGLLKTTGKDMLMLKWLFVSMSAWIGLHHLGNKIGLFSLRPHSTKNHYFDLIQHVLYGITTSAAIKYLADPVMFQQSSTSKGKTQTCEKSPLYTQPFMSPLELEQEKIASQVVY